MINAIKNLIRIQDRLYKRILRTKNLQQKEIRFDKHKQSRNYINVLIRKSRANYYQKNFLRKMRAKHGMVLNLLLASTRIPRKVLAASK